MKYGAIMADPPWRFESWTHAGPPQTAPVAHYDTLTKEEIAAAFRPAELAADDCALFMWALDSMLDQALWLAERWGFAFKAVGFIWVKTTRDMEATKMGMGRWARKETELCLLATRGHPRRLNADVRQIIFAPPGEHSEKPAETYSRIERLVAGPYLEMFARQRWPGWDATGDQTNHRPEPLLDPWGA